VEVRSMGVRDPGVPQHGLPQTPVELSEGIACPAALKTVPATFRAPGSSSRLTEQLAAMKGENPAVSPVLPASRGIAIIARKTFEPEGRRQLSLTDPHTAARVSRRAFWSNSESK
jgi:hypothetical protein